MNKRTERTLIMMKVQYVIDVEEGYELSTKAIINYIFQPDCMKVSKDRITVNLDVLNDQERKLTGRMLEDLFHVKSVKV
jgi:hypothetical protein